MPELVFKGKEFVYNHHLTVPFRPLEPHPDKSIGDTSLEGNLIIHGDNLHALKALMPMYAGRVDCIFIDPPYNTGHEGWCYNDNVNSPVIQEWLNNNPVGIEDGLRHDKWCAMMYPRLRLLNELLGESGSIWMTIDDNEYHRAKNLMDEIFGDNGFVASIAWQSRYSVSNDASISYSHNYILVYSKTPDTWKKLRNEISRDEKQSKQYANPDNDPNGPWRAIPWDAPNIRENLSYPIKTPKGSIKYPPKGRCWSREEDQWLEMVEKGLALFGKNNDGAPSYKRYLKDAETVVPTTWWPHENSGHTDEASKELSKFDLDIDFATPKPVRLLDKILQIATNPDSLILDSFAGSGTTAHSVLRLNRRDNGCRRFILVECEDFADQLTAERMRKVINGYDYEGTYKEELFREKITWSKFSEPKQHKKILNEILAIEQFQTGNFDKIAKTIKDGVLITTGEKKVTKQLEGLEGDFTFCTLGDPIDFDSMLTGVVLPTCEALGAALFHTSTNRPFDASKMDTNSLDIDGLVYLGASENIHIWLIYKPELNFLKSHDAALTLARAKVIAEKYPVGRNLVFAPARFVSQKILNEERLPVEFAPLPFALYNIDRERQS